MSDINAINKLIKEKSREAAIKHTQELNVGSAERILSEVFGNKNKYLNNNTVFEPNFYQCTLKERFYGNGANPQAIYNLKDYLKFLNIPEHEFATIIREQPDFLLWLHDKRSLAEEIDMLVTIASRQLINKMRGASIEDQAKALNTLSKFSTVIKPEKINKDSDFDEMVSNFQSPDQIKEAFKEMGMDVLSEVGSLDVE